MSERAWPPESADDVRIVGWWFHVGRHLLSLWFKLRYRAKVSGKQNLPRHGAILVVANHMTNNDPFFVGWGTVPRRSYYMAKAELFRNRLTRTAISTLGAYPIRRGEADRTALRVTKGLLARGESVIIFPEGTRSKDGMLRNPYPGAASLGLPDDVTVIPAAHWGLQEDIRRAHLVFGPPVSKEGLEGPKSAQAVELSRRIMAAIAGLLPEVGGPVQDPPTDMATMEAE